MAYTVFVDGANGTTGLRIHERLSTRTDIEIVTLPLTEKKKLSARVNMVNQSDISILCLPDSAAKELVEQCSLNAKICDTSTAHRTNKNWVYGFAELADTRATIEQANRVAIPGCHASGFLALVSPLIEKEILEPNSLLSCHSITGYSGGGKSMISEYTNPTRENFYNSPREYSLSLSHKHIPEMMAISGLLNAPLFTPIVADYYNGMLVSVPINTSFLKKEVNTLSAITDFYKSYYANEELIHIHSSADMNSDGTLSAGKLAGRDIMEIWVLGNNEQILLVARFDNLGKGASGAAIQCMNLMLGCKETSGLVL